MRDEPKAKLKLPIIVTNKSHIATLMRSHKRCDPLKTARMWPWKLESSKECVTTHLPKRVALKMEAARVLNLYFAVETELLKQLVGFNV